jgi:hypothetical protein
MMNGFAIIPEVFGAPELDNISRELETAPLKRSRAGIRHLLSVPAIATLARDSRLLNLATAALSCEPVPLRATLFDKSAETNWLVVWHQDTALPLLERREVPGWARGRRSAASSTLMPRRQSLSRLWRCAFISTIRHQTMGRSVFCRERTRWGVLSDDQIHAAAQRIEPVECTLARGGVFAMRPLLVHASSKVVTDAPRRVIHFEYAASAALAHGLHLRAAAEPDLG